MLVWSVYKHPFVNLRCSKDGKFAIGTYRTNTGFGLYGSTNNTYLYESILRWTATDAGLLLILGFSHHCNHDAFVVE
jgi:hypothetical protein